MLERDADARATMYRELQADHQKTSPFVIMFQETEIAALRSNIKGYIIGPTYNDNSFRGVTK